MNIALEISIFGLAHLSKSSRTGIYRVAEQLVLGLLKDPTINVFLTAGTPGYLMHESPSNIRAASIDHWEERVDFSGAQFPNSRLLKMLYSHCVSRASGNGQSGQDLSDLGLMFDRLLTKSGWKERLDDPLQVLQSGDIDIFHSTFNPIPRQFYEKRGKNKRPLSFYTIYDLIPIMYPQYCTPGHVRGFAEYIAGISKDDWLICISNHAREVLIDYANVDPNKCLIAKPAADPNVFYPVSDKEKIAAVRKKYGIGESKYVLTLSAIDPRKNLQQIFRSFAQMQEEGRFRDYKLVMVGPSRWFNDFLEEELIKVSALKKNLIWTDFVAEEDLAALYSAASVFAFTSYCEGFGLPPLEAMQCGTPVIVSDRTSLPEVVGDCGLYVDPDDDCALKDALVQVLGNSTLRDDLSKRSLDRAKQFSWQGMVDDTVAAYKTALAAQAAEG